MGTLVTLDLPTDSPVADMPWVITIGALDDEEDWEPVVCGPYERAHALALAESVVADQDLMAVVEPLQPHVTVDQIRGDIAAARLAAENEDVETAALDAELASYEEDLSAFDEAGDDVHEPSPPPSIDEVRAGFARIAARLMA